MRSLFAATLLVVVLGGFAMAQSQETLPQTPRVQVEQNPDGAAKGQTQSDQQTPGPNQNPAIAKQNPANDAERQTNSDAEKRAEEASEYGIFFGRRLKITDFLLAIFTGLLVLVGIGQGIFLYRTDQGTHMAAQAAKDSADVAKNTLILVQRAFLFIAEVKNGRESDISFTPPKIINYVFVTKWENSGMTPAINFRSVGALKTFTPQELEGFKMDVGGDIPTVGLFLGPKGMATKTLKIPIEEIDEVVAGRKLLLMWGWGEYDDQFPDTLRHRIEFCFNIEITGNPRTDQQSNFINAYKDYNKYYDVPRPK